MSKRYREAQAEITRRTIEATQNLSKIDALGRELRSTCSMVETLGSSLDAVRADHLAVSATLELTQQQLAAMHRALDVLFGQLYAAGWRPPVSDPTIDLTKTRRNGR